MPSIKETINKVESFNMLQKGWHFGDGDAISDDYVKIGTIFLQFAELLGIQKANAFPGENGELQITFYQNNKFLEITIEADRKITVAEDVNDKNVSYEENLNLTEVIEKLKIWGTHRANRTTSEQYTVNTMTRTENAFQVWRSANRLTAEFQLSRRSAPSKRAEQFVIISDDTIQNRLESHLFSGKSQETIYRRSVNTKNLLANREICATTT